MYLTDSNGRRYAKKTRRRFEIFGHAREFTFSCYQRYPFLNSDRTRQWLIDAIEHARSMAAFDLWACVFMPEHAHLLVYPTSDDVELAKTIGGVKEAVARQAIRFLEAESPDWLPRITVTEGGRKRRRFWQPGGGYDRNAYDIKTVHKMIEYIHQNPVRRGLVADPLDWEWSSARWYDGIVPVKLEMDPTVPMMDV